MSTEPTDHGTAYPAATPGGYTTPGLSKREWMAGQILSNPAICHSELMQHQAARAAVEVATSGHVQLQGQQLGRFD